MRLLVALLVGNGALGFQQGPQFKSAPRMAMRMVTTEPVKKPCLGGVAALAAGLFLGATCSAPLPCSAVDAAAGREPQGIRYSALIDKVNAGGIDRVQFAEDGKSLHALAVDGTVYKQEALPEDPELLTILVTHDVDVTIARPPVHKPLTKVERIVRSVAVLLLPFAIVAGAMLLTGLDADGNVADGSPLNIFGIFKPFGDEVTAKPHVSFKDVAGCDSAKLELEEVVDFLKNPTRYTEIGAQIPRGILLSGPPGTGKTLLAKAVAGEANVEFLVASGSSFVEMFAGLGARRVRDLFEKARKKSPCIIFIDEIDAVGRQRGGQGGGDGGSGEREQTLNQILTEMDGFEGNPGVVVIAATNRPDMLDGALLRPGRFDRRVEVALPNLDGRLAILKVHSADKPLATDVDLSAIARRTTGFSGAELRNLMNEAAIMAARQSHAQITTDDVDAAADRLLLGAGRSTKGLAEKAREAAARREAGRAVVAALSPDYDTVQKVALSHRPDGSGGVTVFLPSEERLGSGLYSKRYLQTQLAVSMAARAAEELFLKHGDDVTTAAAADLERARSIAMKMVTSWGMSDKVGPMTVGGRGGELVRPGASAAALWQYGGSSAAAAAMAAAQAAEGADACGSQLNRVVDEEVESLLRAAYSEAKALLEANLPLVSALAARVVQEETVSASEIVGLLQEYGASAVPSGSEPSEGAVRAV